MVKWILRSDKNETIFWGSIYPRMLPLQVNAMIQNNVNVRITREELAKQLEAKGLPPLVFGRDKPKEITVDYSAGDQTGDVSASGSVRGETPSS